MSFRRLLLGEMPEGEDGDWPVLVVFMGLRGDTLLLDIRLVPLLNMLPEPDPVSEPMAVAPVAWGRDPPPPPLLLVAYDADDEIDEEYMAAVTDPEDADAPPPEMRGRA